MLTARNTISEGLNLKNFMGEDRLGSIAGDPLQQPVSWTPLTPYT